MQSIILGMHRSGTSCVTRLVNMMGAYIAPEGIEMLSQPDNPKGFWERTDVMELNDEIDAINQKRTAADRNAELDEKIKGLKKTLKEKGSEVAKIEHKIFDLQQEIKEIIKKEESELNSRFKFTKWKLFNILKSGEVEPTCVPMVDGVSYPNLNTATKLDCGIDIVNTLMKDKGVTFPVFVDNAECNNNVEECVGQSILLYVTEDKKFVVKEM